jgi:acyl-CoA synthetase (AMP-forming)/AMP-acid ligase II
VATKRPPLTTVLRRAGAIELRSSLAHVAALPRLIGRGASLGHLSHINARAFSDKPAIHDRRGTLTWRQLDARANRLARGLTAMGVGPGDRVAALLRNGRQLIEVFVACQKIAAVPCPLNTWGKTAELRSAFENARPKLLIFETQHASQAEGAAPSELPRVEVGPDGGGYEQLLAAHSTRPLPPVTRHRSPPRLVIHTSGTTGRPKGAKRATGIQDARRLMALLSVIPYHRQDVILVPAPMFHSFGILNFTIAAVLGATLVLPERFDPEESLELIGRHKVTVAAFTPVMLHRLVSLPDAEGRADVSSLRVTLVSGSSLPPSLRERAREVFGETLYDLYGSTEAGWVAIATPEDVAKRPDSVGRPVPGVDVVVLGDNGEPLPTGEIGPLYIRSDMKFEGYTGGEATTERDGLFGLGDLGHLDDDGYLHVEGRADDMVVVGGENVYPIEIEEVIRGLQGVDDVAVAGAPDSEYGRVLVAFVVGDVTEERLLEACREALASYKVPKRVEQVPELPRTSTGKVLTRELVAGLTKKE